MNASAQFDAYAATYDEDLNRALSLSGEDRSYFARGRVQWLFRRLQQMQEKPQSILDYGCGIGDTAALLRQMFEAQSVVGVDVSERSLKLAETRNGSPGCKFKTIAEFPTEGLIDLAYCNGVFHHIPLSMRGAAMQYIFRCLRPGGLFAFWENNPWNPGTRYIMSRISFDRDAITLSPPEGRKLVRSVGFEVVRTDFGFFFPHILGWLRVVEPGLAAVPLGAQYQILCRKPQRAMSPVSHRNR